MAALLALIVIFQVKHFFADYVFQDAYMLKKFNKENWLGPLTCHALVHSVFTLAITYAYVPLEYALGFALLDFCMHFAIDKGKVMVSRGLSPDNKVFWWWLGADQMMHHLTHYVIAFYTLSISL